MKPATSSSNGSATRQPSDAVLVSAARANDAHATTLLITRHMAVARAAAVRSGARAEDLDDILQDAVVEALDSLETLRRPESFKSWFAQIVTFTTRAYGRRDAVRRRSGLRDLPKLVTVDDMAVTRATPESAIAAREISGALRKLPMKVQLAIAMRHLEGRNIQEIATSLQSSPASVKRYLLAAEQALHRAMHRDAERAGEPVPVHRRQRRVVRNRALLLLGLHRRRPRGPREAPADATAPSRIVGAVTPARVLATLAGVTALGVLAVCADVAAGDRPPRTVTASGAIGPVTSTAHVAAPPSAPADAPAAEATMEWVARAAPADALVASMGVNVRLSEDRQDFPLVRRKLLELGVRHVSDLAGSRLDWLAALASAGITTNLFVEVDTDVHATVAPHAAFVEAVTLKQERGDIPLAEWARRQRRWMEETRARLEADPATRGIALVGATIANEDKRLALGDVSAFVDFGGVGAPSRQLPPGGAFFDGTLAVYRPLYGATKPMVVPQVSFSTAACAECLREDRQANYYVRTFFESHRRGIARTYGAYLFDRRRSPQRFDDGMGLLRADGREKVAFDALRRTVQLFSDPGPAFPTRDVAFEARGATEHLAHATFQRRDGRVLVALWLDVASGPDSVGESVHVSPPPGLRPWAVHHLVRGERVAMPSDASDGVALRVTDEVSVLELVPAP